MSVTRVCECGVSIGYSDSRIYDVEEKYIFCALCEKFICDIALWAEYESANQRIAEQEAAQRWILVTERLPEKDPNSTGRSIYVEVVIEEKYHDFGYCCLEAETKRWRVSINELFCDPVVTHWKYKTPLPAPPEDSKLQEGGQDE